MIWIQSWLVAAALSLTGGQVPTSAALAPNWNVISQAHHGQALGHWRLPDTAGPGMMVGRFFSQQGVALLEVHAQVLAPLPGETAGQLQGVVSTLVGPHPGPIGELRGHWIASTIEAGAFKAHIVRPAHGGSPAQVIGALNGQFLDPQGPLPPGGQFHGHWLLNP
ncbi:MAG: hypothetical protein ABIP42_14080 [Planctomycetota bacterium]